MGCEYWRVGPCEARAKPWRHPPRPQCRCASTSPAGIVPPLLSFAASACSISMQRQHAGTRREERGVREKRGISRGRPHTSLLLPLHCSMTHRDPWKQLSGSSAGLSPRLASSLPRHLAPSRACPMHTALRPCPAPAHTRSHATTHTLTAHKTHTHDHTFTHTRTLTHTIVLYHHMRARTHKYATFSARDGSTTFIF
jgi:hypothetical protein